jgi:hypothetical protein
MPSVRYSKSGSVCLSMATGPVSEAWRMFREAGLRPRECRPRVAGGKAIDHGDECGPRWLAAKFEFIERSAQFEKGRALAASEGKGGVDVGLASSWVAAGVGAQPQ